MRCFFVILKGRGKFGTIPSEAPQVVHSWRGEHRRLDASLPEYRPSAIRRDGYLGGVSPPGSTDLGAACEVERVNDPQHLRSSQITVASELRLLSLSLSLSLGHGGRSRRPGVKPTRKYFAGTGVRGVTNEHKSSGRLEP